MRHLGKAGFRFAAFVAAFGLFAALPAQAYKKAILRVGFVPSENSAQMAQKVAPLLADLSKRVGMKTVSFVAQDYPGVVEAMKHRKVDAAFLAPLPSVMAEREANGRILLKATRYKREFYYSAIIVRRDSGLRTVKDLKGKRFAFGDPFSMAGNIFPKAVLRSNGLDPDRDVEFVSSGGHDQTVLAVFNKAADAGAVFANDPLGKEGAWSFHLRTPDERSQIVPINISKPIPNDTFTVRADLDAGVVAKLKAALLAMSATPGLLHEIYHLDGLKEAKYEDYESVREILSQSVRKKLQ